MKIHPCAKVNLGLNIVERRPDGYHNLQTVFYPIGLHDTIEIEEAAETTLSVEGHPVAGQPEQNLVVRAYRMLEADFGLPPVAIRLHKQIPMQAGMGGGSSDGACTLRLLNTLFGLQLDADRLRKYAARLGADCAFFIEARPAYAEGIGERLQPIDLDLSTYHFAIVKPDIAVSTREAYAAIRPRVPASCCRDVVRLPVAQWRDKLTNDFEEAIFPQHPQIAAIKQWLYAQGALYAAMSGSGSSVFGIFGERPRLKTADESLQLYIP